MVGRKLSYEMFKLLTLTEEQRAPGEQSRLATTAFSLPEDVPDILRVRHVRVVRGKSSDVAHLSNQISSMNTFEGNCEHAEAEVI